MHGCGTRTCKLRNLVHRGVVRDGLVKVDESTDHGIGIQRTLRLKYGTSCFFFPPYSSPTYSASPLNGLLGFLDLFNGCFDSCSDREVFSPGHGPRVDFLSRGLGMNHSSPFWNDERCKRENTKVERQGFPLTCHLYLDHDVCPLLVRPYKTIRFPVVCLA